MELKTSTQMADLYGLKSAISFNKLLAECGILQSTDKGYVLSDSLRGQGLAVTVNTWFFLPGGIKASKRKAAWTEAGQQYIHQHLSRLGIMPQAEQRDLFTA